LACKPTTQIMRSGYSDRKENKKNHKAILF